ncbi:MAG TPA: hypothetical protein VFU54_11170 [Actinomycetota bacterium]|nr:hypothetical protein [Actinomycetota bacterium]
MAEELPDVVQEQVGGPDGGEVAAAVELRPGEAEIQQASLVRDRVLQSIRRPQPSPGAGAAEVSGGR